MISFEELVAAVSETLKEVGVKAVKIGAGEKVRGSLLFKCFWFPPEASVHCTTEKLFQTAFPTEAPLLELVHGCIKALPTAQLRSCWAPFQSLFADAPLANLPPRAVFLLYMYVFDNFKLARR